MPNTLFKAGPRQTREYIVDCFEAGNIPFVHGPPGSGKSALFKSVAKQFQLWMIDHRLSTSQPEDLSGMPDFERSDIGGGTKATFRPFDIFPTVGTPIPKGFEGWMLFLDEANSAMKEVQAASYKLVLDKMTGQVPLHERVLIGMAGNQAEDHAIVNPLSTAMQSRIIHIIMEVIFAEWFEDVAMAENYDERIRGYLSWKNGALMAFEPEHDDFTFPCPRTWEFMNNFIKGKTFAEIDKMNSQTGVMEKHFEMDRKTGLFAGTIGQGEAVSFVQYCKTTKDLITIDRILADPTGCKVPDLAEQKFAQISHLMDKIDAKNFADLATYISRYDVVFKVLFFRQVRGKNPELQPHPAFTKAMLNLAQYLD